MEKMIWEKPEMNENVFPANAYCVACGDTGISSYNFECNAPRGDVYYYTNGQVQAGAVKPSDFTNYTVDRLGGYYPCGEKHDTGDSTDFFWGFVDWNDDGKHTINENTDETAIVWVEFLKGIITGKPYVDDWHATTELDMTKWEHSKS